MLLYICIVFIFLHNTSAGVLREEALEKYPREVGGHVSRTFPFDQSQFAGRNEREVGGQITRNNPGMSKRDTEEIWTVVQTEEENLTMDNVRGKDVPLSLTTDFRGIEPVLPVQYDGFDYPQYLSFYQF